MLPRFNDGKSIKREVQWADINKNASLVLALLGKWKKKVKWKLSEMTMLRYFDLLSLCSLTAARTKLFPSHDLKRHKFSGMSINGQEPQVQSFEEETASRSEKISSLPWCIHCLSWIFHWWWRSASMKSQLSVTKSWRRLQMRSKKKRKNLSW